MLVCPNKSSQQWKDLSKKLGEGRAMLSFIRNNNEIPATVSLARELITNVGILNSLESIPELTEEKMIDTLINQGLAFDSFHDIDGKRFYALNPDVKDLGRRLAELSSDFGAVLQYTGDYVTVSPEGLTSWNAIAKQQNKKTKTADQLARSFLTRIGIKISEQDDVLEQYGSNGIANFAEKMVLIQSGKSKEALPEEALHFFLDMIPQDTPELLEALDKVRNTDLYRATLALYKDNPNYKTKNGEIRFDKIKKEALAKQIAENLNAAPTSKIGKLIQKIIAWITGTRIQKSPIEVLEDMFRSEDISRLNMNLTSTEVYNQLSDETKKFYESQDMTAEQKATLNNILAITQAINFKEDTHTLTFIDPITGEPTELKSATTVLGSDFYSELESPDVMAEIIQNFELEFPGVVDPLDEDEQKAKKLTEHLVNQIIKGEFEKEDLSDILGPKLSELLFQSAENRKKTLFGTAIHSIVEAIILDRTIDFDNPEMVNPIIFNFMDKKGLEELIYGTKSIYGTTLKPGIKKMIQDLVDSGHTLMTEVEIGNKKLGGIIDIIAIDKNGIAHIYDFKTKYLKDKPGFKNDFKNIDDEFDYVTGLMSTGGVKFSDGVLPEVEGKRRSLKEKWAQQLSIYKKILMEAGVMVGNTTVIGVGYKLNAEGKVTKIKAFTTNPLQFNDMIAAGYFPDLNMNMDANKKSEGDTAEDERVKLLDSISKPKMKEAFGKMLGRLNQIYAYFKKNKNARAIYDILSDEDGSNRVEDMKRLVENFLANYGEDGDLQNMLAIQKAFIDIVDSAGPIIKLVSDEFERLKATTSPDQASAVQKMNEMMKVRDFVVGYQNMFKEMLSYLNTTDTTNPLVVRLNEMVGAVINIRNSYVDYITPSVISALGSEFTKELLDNMIREFGELIASADARGDKKRAEELRKERDNLPSEKVIAALLKGDKSDAGWVYSKFLPTISNPDIIIAAVAKRLKRVLDGVRLKMKTFRDGFSVEFNKRTKVYGKGIKLGMKAMNEPLVYEAKIFNAGAADSFQLMFKSEFLEDLYYDYDKLRHELSEAIKTGDKVVISIAKKKVKEFEIEYFQSNYTADYYRLTRMMDTTVNYGGERLTIREITGSIFEEIRVIESQYDKNALAEGRLSKDHIEDRQRLWEQYYELMALKNADGTDKTGDALTIAKSLQEYQKNKRLIFDDVELTGLFEKMKNKVLLQYGEDSDIYKKWIANNTRLKVSDRYYEEMDILMKELASLSTNPNAEKITELYQELRTITQPFKDKDGFINGQFIKPEIIQKIKDIQEEIKELQDQVNEYTPDGFTYEEKQILKEQAYLRKNEPSEYDKYTVQEIYANRDARLDDDPDLKIRVDRAKEIKAQLASMRTVQNTKYYFEELENQERIFAKAAGVTYEELKINSELYQEFRESKWFEENHNHNTKALFDDTFGSTVFSKAYEPIYIWTRNVPVKEYIEERPARHFYKRVLKDSYVNDKGETIKLINEDNRDIQNRYKPKTNAEYRSQYGKEHKYLNKDFISLRDKYNNKTATEREKVDYENLLYLHKTMLENQEDIEPKYRLGLAVPFVEKDEVDRFVESKGKNVKSGVQDALRGLKRKFTKTEASGSEGFGEGISSSPTDFSRLATIDNDEVRYIPVKYTSKGAASDNSYDVWGSVLNYVGSTIRKKDLDKELALINGLEEILGEKENQPKGENKNLMINNVMTKYFPNSPELIKRINLGSNTRLEVLKSFVNSVLYNEEHFEGYDILGVNSQKVIDGFMKLSSYTMLGLAPFNWTVNWLSGQVQNMVEAAGGRYYDFKSYMSAKKEIYISTKYGHIMKDMMSDYSKVGKKSFWGQIIEVFDPIQGEVDDGIGHKTSWNKFTNILRAGIFAGKIWGEWEIQMSSFIAFMKNVKLYNGKMYDKDSFITLKVGTDFTGMTVKEIRNKKIEALKEFDKLNTNLLDIMELKDGTLSIKKQHEAAFEIGSKQFSDLIAKLHSMQKRINGSYAKFDQAYAAKSSMGRMMFFFRKYLVQLGMNRLGQRRPDFEGMTVEQGFYLTFAQTVLKDIALLRWKMLKWNNYSDTERAAIAKTFTDIGVMFTCWLIYGALLGYDPNDKDRIEKLRSKGWAAQATVWLMLKVKSETEQFIPLPGMGLDELKRLYSNPSIMFGTATNFLVMGGQIFGHMKELIGFEQPELYYKKDVGENPFKQEGHSKLLANFMQTFLGYTAKTWNPLDGLRGFEYSQRLK